MAARQSQIAYEPNQDPDTGILAVRRHEPRLVRRTKTGGRVLSRFHAILCEDAEVRIQIGTQTISETPKDFVETAVAG